MNTTLDYEFPLNERIRIFIRLEQLFKQLQHFSASPSVIDKRAAISVLLEIMMIFNRNDIKSEILKELDRNKKALQKLASNAEVDADKLKHLESQIADISKKLYARTGKVGLNLMQSDLFQSIAQRSAIPGGTCSFDLPEYHYWLEQDESTRLKNLQHWTNPFDDSRDALALILHIIRDSGSLDQEVAEAGFFQIALDHTLPHQLLKVSVSRSIHCFAEISGGKHRCTVRFMQPSTDSQRPSQSPNDIPFSLTCCIF